MNVRRYDYEAQILDWPKLMRRIESALRSGDYVLGPTVERFENQLAKFLDVPHALGVGCGTDALHLALRGSNIGRGDRVVTQANTFHATVAAILLAGGEPVLVDADPESFNLSPPELEALGGRLHAVLPVHLFGRPCDMDAIMDFAKRHDALVVEDAAQAIGARYRGRRVGSIGDFGCISFHPSKNLAAAGDGGAITFGDGRWLAPLQALRSLGQVAQNDHRYVGINSKLDVIQTLVLEAKLGELDRWNADRRRIAGQYVERLAGLPVQTQSAPADIEHAYHLFQIRTPERDSLRSALSKAGVDAVVRYPTPIHLQPAFSDLPWRKGQFPVAEALADELLALPIRPGMPVSEVDYVCEKVTAYFGRGGS